MDMVHGFARIECHSFQSHVGICSTCIVAKSTFLRLEESTVSYLLFNSKGRTRFVTAIWKKYLSGI